MKQPAFEYLKRFKKVRFTNELGSDVHIVPIDNFSMRLRVIQSDDPDDPEFEYFFHTSNGIIEVDGVTYMEAEEFFAKEN